MSVNSYSPLISKIYTSRNILLEIFKARGFDVEDYIGFSVTEVHILYNNKQLDMFLENKNTTEKLYIKYHLATRLGQSHIYEYVDDLFEVEEVLKDSDELIIISKDKTNQTIQDLIEQQYIKDNKFINIYNINNYLFNILNHSMVPKHIILSDPEKEEIKKKYNITDDKEFPEISRFDPVAKTIGLRPSKLCKIIRSSPTSVESNYYRLCY